MEIECVTNRYSFSADDMIAQGNTAEVYRLKDGKVLKLFREELDKEAMEREFLNSKIVSNTLQNVPKVYDFIEYNGRYGIVFQMVSGRDMFEPMLSQPLKLAKWMKELASYHASIAQPITDDIRTMKSILRTEINLESDLTEDEKNKVLRYLEQLPTGDCLCHFDFHPGNVIMSEENIFFIDWMNACKGDPCADVARTYLLLRYGEPMHIPFFKLMLMHWGMCRGSRIYLKEYCKLTGNSEAVVKSWILPIAAARLSEWLTVHEKNKLLSLIRNNPICK